MSESQPTSEGSAMTMPDLLAGLLLGMVILILAGSFDLLIFTGPLAAYAGYGITIALISAAVIGVGCALLSSSSGLIAIPQDRTAPIIAFMASSIVATMGSTAAPATLVGTVMAANLTATFLTGLLVFYLGRLNLANLIRFIPYPVIGGFLAGSGWLLATGSIKAMTGVPFSWLSAIQLVRSGEIIPWIPAALFGTVLFIVMLRLRHWAVLPAFIIGGVLVFYGCLLAAGLPLDAARENEWIFTRLGGGSLDLAPLLSVMDANWQVVLLQGGSFAAIALTSLVSILLNSSAIELDSNQEIDLNRELQVTGCSNLAASLGCGMVGFASLSLTRLGREMGARTRWVGFVAACVCGLIFLVGSEPMAYIPKFILGGLLVYLGLRFLHQWVIEARRRLPHADYAAVILILVVIGTAGYLQGVLIGLVTATILFVVNYSRVQVVTLTLNGTQQRSNVDRSAAQNRLLNAHGEEIYILKLQGFIFFGSANNLLDDLRARLNNFDLPAPQFVILDFCRVDGIDSSAALTLSRMRSMAGEEGFVLILCRVAPALEAQLLRSGYDMTQGPFFRIERDLDHSLEWCEDRLLDRHGAREDIQPGSFENYYHAYWPPGEASFKDIVSYLEKQEVGAGNRLILQGDDSNDMFFIAAGRVSTYLELQNGQSARLRTMGAGTVIGELGLFLEEPRTASIIADECCTVYRLTRENLHRMRREKPELASAFHHFMTRMMANRLVATSRTLRAIMD